MRPATGILHHMRESDGIHLAPANREGRRMAKQTRDNAAETKQKTKTSDNATKRNTGPAPRTQASDHFADGPTLAQLEAIAGGADEDDLRLFLDPDLGREVDKLDAETEEEIDALRVDLVQDGGASHTTDNSGGVVDDMAVEDLARAARRRHRGAQGG
jgi:hypothetical protein